MKLVHIFYQEKSEHFINDGNLFLWIESSEVITEKYFYPYQLSKDKLLDWYQSNIDVETNTITVEGYLPCSLQSKPIPSPLICNYCDIEETSHTSLNSFYLYAIEIDSPLSILKSLSFLQNYLDEDIKLADDTKFWIQVGLELSSVINNDQYIPAIVATKDKSKIKYYNKWQTLSYDFDKKLKALAQAMPFSGCLSGQSLVDRFSVLKNFSESTLNKIVLTTAFSNKLYKDCKDTLVEKILNKSASDITEEEYIKWLTWKNNLSHEQYGSSFNVCIRLNSATNNESDDWSLEILMQSHKDPSHIVSISDYFTTKSTKVALNEKMFGFSIEKGLLLQLGLACRIYPKLEEIFSSNLTNSIIDIDTEDAYQFLKEDAWTLKASGYRIIVPSWWSSKGRVKAKIKMKASKSSQSDSDNSTGYFDASNLARFDYKLAMGEHEVSPLEWQALLDSKTDLVYFRGQWVEIDTSEMEKMQKLIETQIRDKATGSLKDLLVTSSDSDVFDLELDTVMEGLLSKLNNKDTIDLEKQPNSLQATLRPYQLRGLSWLSNLENMGLNPCLADDMGLGKTMQVIALLLSNPKDKPALLIAPTSVVGNWLREMNRFAPSLKATIHHGAKRKDEKDFSAHVGSFDVVITSYGTIRRDKKLFNDYHWSRLILDEAHNIKNPLAAQTKIICKIPSSSRIAITGTPVENRLLDLWSIFDFLNPGFLGSRSSFKNTFEYPIQKDSCPKKTKVLKNLVEPFILRRLKTDKNIIQDLPDKIEQKVYCELSQEQALIYQSIVDDITQELTKSEDLTKRSAIILSSLLKLKQCCNHPAQVLQDNSEFSLSRSVKLQRLAEMTKEIISNGESLLIFSQFTDICESINKMLKTEFGLQTYYLHGGTSRKKRETMINDFQDEHSKPAVFILSLKAGGVGITLTKANHVIHFDRWWNPAIENQATDRAYRIGQQKTVFAYKYITMGTIEEKIDKMLEDKKRVAGLVVGSDESWLSKLDSKSFIDLINLSKVYSEKEYEAS
ncbi:MAG: DEAD/DEAH box helicase [Legionellaceae bacterium]|nr:DEAD/DEAH box helicase [Legionellaceae bacterium]